MYNVHPKFPLFNFNIEIICGKPVLVRSAICFFLNDIYYLNLRAKIASLYFNTSTLPRKCSMISILDICNKEI